MKLSIIIPVYNAEKYIGECIKSILQCDSSDIEIIIINDGSKDKSLSIIKEYQKNDKRIYVIDKKNEGVSIARNTGIKEAKGDWIMFVDADDILTNDWFDIIKGYMSSDFKILFFTNYLKRNDYTKEEFIKNIVGINGDNYIAGPVSKLFSRKFIEELGIKFQQKLINGEDMIFIIECLSATSDYEIINKSFYKYRINEQSATHTFNINIIESDKYFHKILEKILRKSSLDKNQVNAILLHCKKNALYIMMMYLSYLKRYKDVRNYLYLFNDEIYSNIKIKKVKSKKDIISFFIIKKMYYIAYKIIRINNFFKNLCGIKKKKNIKFIEI